MNAIWLQPALLYSIHVALGIVATAVLLVAMPHRSQFTPRNIGMELLLLLAAVAFIASLKVPFDDAPPYAYGLALVLFVGYRLTVWRHGGIGRVLVDHRSGPSVT